MKPPWTLTPLGDLLTERRETPQPVDLATGAVRIVSKIGFNEGRLELRTGGETKTPMILIQPGDLLVSGINAAKGAIAIYGESNQSPIAATIHYGAYAPRKKQVDTKFLWWLLRSGTFRELLLQYVPGGIKTELKAKRLLPIPIPLPPLSEQKRIVARIEELAGKIEEAKRLRRQASVEASALIATATSSVLCRHEEQADTLDNLAVKITDGEHITPRRSETGRLLLSARNIQDGRIDLRVVDHVDEAEFSRIRKRCDPDIGDVLLSCSGSIGKVALVDRERCYVMVRSVAMIRPLASRIIPEFLAHALRSSFVQEQLHSKSKATAQANIFLGRIKSVLCPIPPIQEQHRIVAYLDDLQAKVDSLKKLQAESSAELDALLPSVLDKAFKGEL